MWRQVRLTSRVIGSIFFCSLLAPAAANAQDAAALAARLHATAEANAIDGAGMLPWHLKMDAQLFDEKGKAKEQGTIEEWWGGPEMYRVVFTFPSYTGTQLHNKDGAFETKGGTFEPGVLDDLLDQVVHPMRHEEEFDLGTPLLRNQKFGPVALECIMLNQAIKKIAFPPWGLFPTYCLDPGKNDLRITNELGSLTLFRNRIGTFQGRLVAVDISGRSDELMAVTGHVTALTAVQLTDADFVPGDDLVSVVESAAKVGAATVAGRLLTRPDPVYPLEAKQNRIWGAVIMHAIIGRDGHIRSLRLISAADPSLAVSAIAAVRRWTYQPYVLNGTPTEVDTTITVNFTFGAP